MEKYLRVAEKFPGLKNTHHPNVNILEYMIKAVIHAKTELRMGKQLADDVNTSKTFDEFI